MSIRGKLLSLILCISFIPVLVVGYINFSNFKEISRQQVLKNLDIFAAYKHEKIDLYLAELKTRVIDFASDGYVRDGLEKLDGADDHAVVAAVRNHLIENKQALDERIISIDLIDHSGIIAVSTDTARRGIRRADIPELHNELHAKQSGVYINDVVSSDADGDMTIEVITDVSSRTDNAHNLGHMAVRFDAGFLDLLMTSQWLFTVMQGERDVMGETDETYLVNSAGLMINHSRHLNNELLSTRVETEPVTRCLNSGASMSGRWINYRGVEVVGAAHCLDMGGFRWVLLSEISVTEAFSLIDDYKRFFNVALLIVLLLIVGVAVFVTRVISRPISALNEGAKKVAQGDLDYRVGTDKRDEIGELSRHFDSMVSAFRDSKGEIESVNRDLLRANHEFNFISEAMDQHAIIVETDVSGVITRVNRGFCEVSQYSEQELVGRTHRVINSGYHPKEFFQGMWATIKSGRVWHGDIRNRRKDGTLYWVRTTIVPHLDANGRVDRYIALRTEITHQKRVEDNLIRSNRALLASARIQKVIMSAEHEQDLLRRACEALVIEGGYRFAWVGYARNDERKRVEPIVRSGYEEGYLDQITVTWGDDELGRGPVGRAIRLGREIIIRDVVTDSAFTPWQQAALERGYMSVIALPLKLDGRIGGVLAIYSAERDVFDADEVKLLKLLADDIGYGIAGLRVRTERDMAELALKESEINLKRAQEIARLGSWEWDLADDKFIWSDELYRILGYKPGEVTPTLGNLVAAVVPEQRVMVEEQTRSCIADGCSRSLEFEIIRRNGEQRFVRSQLVVYCAGPDAGVATRVAGTLIDITEQKRSERESQSLQNQLQHAQKMHSIGQLTGGVAHDFNNILSSILGYTTLAIEECPVNDVDYLSYLEEVNKAGARAKKLISQLMTFSRRDTHEMEVVNPTVLVQDAYKMVKTVLPAAVEFKMETEVELPPVRVNQVKLHQVITNLVINARDAIENFGEVSLQVRRRGVNRCLCTSCQQSFSGDYIEISVSDSGKGIDEENMLSIFEPFFTTKETGKGTGMGLSMVHGLIHSHNGHVRVESTVGKGSRFAVYLPIHHEAGDLDDTGEAEALESMPASTNGSGTILLVDDEEAITRILGDLLKRYGYHCIKTSDPSEALQLFLEDPDAFDLVITDLKMPHMNGMELAQRLLTMRPALPVILCTGFSGELREQEVIEAGLRGLLDKPIDLKRLVLMVEELLPGPDSGVAGEVNASSP